MKRKPKYLSEDRKRQEKLLRRAARELSVQDKRLGYTLRYSLEELKDAARTNKISEAKLIALCKDRMKPEKEKEPAFAVVPVPQGTSVVGKWIKKAVSLAEGVKNMT